jgi:hypothetical protein
VLLLLLLAVARLVGMLRIPHCTTTWPQAQVSHTVTWTAPAVVVLLLGQHTLQQQQQQHWAERPKTP